MAVGLQVFNDNGTLQFDSESPAYAFVHKGTITTGDFGAVVDQYNSWSLAYQENLPPFDAWAVSCTSGAVAAGGMGVSDSTSILFNAVGGSHTITYYLFRSYSKLPSIPGAGFECFTPNGQLAYSTAYRPLTIVAKHPVTSMYYNMSEGRALPAGRQHAFMAYGSMQRDMGNGGGSGGGYDVPTINFSAANAAVRLGNGAYYVEEVRGNGFVWNPLNGGFLVVDVTGL